MPRIYREFDKAMRILASVANTSYNSPTTAVALEERKQFINDARDFFRKNGMRPELYAGPPSNTEWARLCRQDARINDLSAHNMVLRAQLRRIASDCAEGLAEAPGENP